jgi:hypothetical protein
MALLTAMVTGCPKPAVSLGGRLAGLEAETFRALFLGPEDLGGMRMTQDARTRGPDPGDRGFATQQGILSGLAVWSGPPDAALGRIVDVRWTFPSGKQARRYLRDNLARLSERQRPLPDAPLVGADGQVFGGSLPNPFSLRVVHYIYLFRVGNVVIKLYAAQGHAARQAALTPERIVPVAQAIVQRIVQNARPPQ